MVKVNSVKIRLYMLRFYTLSLSQVELPSIASSYLVTCSLLVVDSSNLIQYTIFTPSKIYKMILSIFHFISKSLNDHSLAITEKLPLL